MLGIQEFTAWGGVANLQDDHDNLVHHGDCARPRSLTENKKHHNSQRIRDESSGACKHKCGSTCSRVCVCASAADRCQTLLVIRGQSCSDGTTNTQPHDSEHRLIILGKLIHPGMKSNVVLDHYMRVWGCSIMGCSNILYSTCTIGPIGTRKLNGGITWCYCH